MQPLISLTSTPALELARTLAAEFALTALERDRQGGTPKAERDRIRESGLLRLIIPQEYGGMGENWITALTLSRELARVDSSIAHVYSYHHLGVIIPHIFGTPEQKAFYYSETARHNWFWCNALNPLDRRTFLKPEGEHFCLNGVKSFCSGSHDSDILPITATHEETGAFLVLAIPTQRPGVILHHDWDNMGQRQTDSGRVSFENVPVYSREILGNRDRSSTPFGTIRACLTQLNLAHIYLGIAQGALEAAVDYTREYTQPWLTSGVETATTDPYILHNYGELWVDLQAASCLADRAAQLLQAAWEQEWALGAEQRGECALAIYAAKVAAHRAGLTITNRIFEAMGARSTSNQYGFDRYWRNLRTFTLHDPIDYKLRDLGNWLLNSELPQPGFYS